MNHTPQNHALRTSLVVGATGIAGSATIEHLVAGHGSSLGHACPREGLAEADLSRLAYWWHTDGDLGRTIEVVTEAADRSRSMLASRPKAAGFGDRGPMRGKLALRPVGVPGNDPMRDDSKSGNATPCTESKGR